MDKYSSFLRTFLNYGRKRFLQFVTGLGLLLCILARVQQLSAEPGHLHHLQQGLPASFQEDPLQITLRQLSADVKQTENRSKPVQTGSGGRAKKTRL
jgi:hypothetical protein